MIMCDGVVCVFIFVRLFISCVCIYIFMRSRLWATGGLDLGQALAGQAQQDINTQQVGP